MSGSVSPAPDSAPFMNGQAPDLQAVWEGITKSFSEAWRAAETDLDKCTALGRLIGEAERVGLGSRVDKAVEWCRVKGLNDGLIHLARERGAKLAANGHLNGRDTDTDSAPATNLEVALRHARNGLPVFPARCVFNKAKGKWDKIPILDENWKEIATADEATIIAWWTKYPNAVPGIHLGGCDLIVVDPDRHGDGDGVAAFDDLIAKRTALPPHPVCDTAGSGRHHYFRQWPGEKLGNSKGDLPKNVDVRGTGGWTVAPGSIRSDGARWSWVEIIPADIPILPDWLGLVIRGKRQESISEKATKARDKARQAEPRDSGDVDEKLVRSALDAIPADDRDTWRDVGMALHSTGATWARSAWDAWSATSNKFDGKEQDKAWKSFDRARGGPSIGIGTLFLYAKQNGWKHPGSTINMDNLGPRAKAGGGGSGDDGGGGDAPDSLSDDAIEAMNRKYCVVSDGGNVFVFANRYDAEMDRRVYDRMRRHDFMMLHSNDMVSVRPTPEDKATRKSIAGVWLTDKRRRTYKAVVFDPTTTESRDGNLNLWRGFAVEPKEGSWQKLKDHVFNVVCQGNDPWFLYLLGWMARAVQQPASQGEVAVVMRGGKGVGKGVLAHALRKIFGQHGMYVAKSKHLVGAFNDHLRDCVLLFSDEAFFAGDRASEGTLKALVTEEVLAIEPKRQNVILTRNRLHIMMASNEEWVVPASLDERRFFVLDVPKTRQGDLPYFEEIIAELEGGGYAAMLYDLLNHDISEFNVRRIPQTAALDDQKRLSMPLECQWWHEVLSRGYVYRSKLGLEDWFGQWHEWMATDVLYDSYLEYAKARNERYPKTRESFGRFMAQFAKPSRPRGDGVTGEHQTRGGVYGNTEAKLVKKDRPAGYNLGDINRAREEFENVTGLTFEWGPEEVSE